MLATVADIVPVIPPSLLVQANVAGWLPGDSDPVPLPIVVQASSVAAAPIAAASAATRRAADIDTEPWSMAQVQR